MLRRRDLHEDTCPTDERLLSPGRSDIIVAYDVSRGSGWSLAAPEGRHNRSLHRHVHSIYVAAAGADQFCGAI